MRIKLAKREKYYVGIAIGFITIILFYELIIDRFFENKEYYQKGIETKEEELRNMTAWISEYTALKRDLQGMEMVAAGKRDFTLFSFLDKAAGTTQIKDHITSMKPSTSKETESYKEEMMEVKINAITLNQLVEYLHRIESPRDRIIIKRIQIKENKRKSGFLDVILQVITYELGA